jgi:hypothetical protein
MHIRPIGLSGFCLAVAILWTGNVFAQAPVLRNPEVSVAQGAVTIPVRNMPEAPLTKGNLLERPLRLVHPGSPVSSATDPVLQNSASVNAAAVTSGLNFEGLGDGFTNFTVDAAPPDPNGAAGATQFVEWVNESFEVFSKTGTSLKGPIAGNQLFQALGTKHPCAVNNDGDPIVQYDKANNRWILTQFSVTNGSANGFWQCVAVSSTSDATGTFHVYAFQQPSFNDYPKLGVWPTGYFVTFNMFTNTFQGPRICALDGAAMRAGAAATQICFQISTSFASLLPSDVDGTLAPPGDPFFVSFGSGILNVWRAHVNFSTGAGTLTGPITTSIPAFSEACNGGSCIPQPSTSQKLDSLGDRLMYRFAYRNFGNGHESLLVNHSVKVSRTQPSGVRWYELAPNATTGGLKLVQSGTFAPADGLSRWMGSIAQDKFGNIAVGYSTSSKSAFPSIKIATRAPGDPAGTLGSETTIFSGSGSQLRNLNRWGDYTSMSIDPADDCTFWYTNEYLAASGTFNWHTRISSFKLPGCP